MTTAGVRGARPDLPTGTVTFLFSDLEGSTRLTQELGTAAFREVLEQHHRVLRTAFEAHGGVERGTQGDAFLVIFHEAPAAVAAAVAAQRALAAADWPPGVPIRVRIGLHTGEGIRGGDDYVGVDVNRAARVASVGHGGQILLSEATRVLAERSLPSGTSLRDLGEHRLRDLAAAERLSQVVVDGLPSDFPPLRTASARTVELPPRLTAFLGRDRELGDLEGLLARSRLVTLTGPGGTGKTSLGVELARRRAGEFADGVWFVPLDGVSEAEHVGPTIATALHMPDPGKADAARIAAFLGDREVLLVLDNFEHVVGAARLVADVLRATSALRIVVTSRAPLHVSGEQEYPVAPLPIASAHPDGPEAADAAVALFVDRARLVRPGFLPSPGELGIIAEICARLDGLPLGIELAAAHVRLLSPAAIRDRLADRIDLPGPRSRDLPERQRSLRGAIAWSYDLLDEPERRLLEALSVFAGGFRLEDAESVGAAVLPRDDVLEAFAGLVDQSLAGPAGEEERTRHRLLDTIRMFAAERLESSGRAEAVRRAHAEAVAALFESALPYLPGREQVAWIPLLEADQDNHRAAIRWAIGANETELAMRLGAAAWRFWQITGHVAEGRETMDCVLGMPGAEHPSPLRVRALEAAGGLHYWAADNTAADRHYGEQIALARAIGDRRGLADGVFNAAHTASVLSDPERSVALAREAAALYAELGDAIGLERTQVLEAGLLMIFERHLEAVEVLERAMARYQELDDAFYVSLAAGFLAGANLALGRIPEAMHWGREGILASRALGDVGSLTLGLADITVFARVTGMHEVAVTMAAAYEGLCQRYGVRPPMGAGLIPGYDWQTEDSAAALGPAAAARAAARGAAMSLDEALDYVLELLRPPSAG